MLAHDYYVDDVHDSSNFNFEMNPYFCDERLTCVVDSIISANQLY